MSVIFFFLAASEATLKETESLDPGLDCEVQFQAYQQHLLKASLWIRLNAQRRRKKPHAGCVCIGLMGCGNKILFLKIVLKITYPVSLFLPFF